MDNHCYDFERDAELLDKLNLFLEGVKGKAMRRWVESINKVIIRKVSDVDIDLQTIRAFHSRDQHLCKFIRTKQSVYIRKEYNSQKTCLGHQHGRHFVVFFRSPQGARKNTSNGRNVRSYYMLNHRIRGLLFHYKKKCYFAIGFHCFW